jgi:hypothetical protein
MKNQGIFYVGKGVGRRAESHIAAAEKTQSSDGNNSQFSMLDKIRTVGTDHVQIDILIHGLRDENEAFNCESAVIDALGLKNLHNRVRGHDSLTRGKMSLQRLNADFGAKPIENDDIGLMKLVFIRVPRSYQPGAGEAVLYEAVRKSWVIAERRRILGTRWAPDWAVAVHGGVTYGVYRIEKWRRRPSRDSNQRERWGFIGHRDAKVEKRLLNKDVSALIPHGAQWPLKFVNCG